MANYIPWARTNYFKVKDEQKFREDIIDKFGLDYRVDQDRRYGLFPDEDFPSYYEDEDGEWKDIIFEDEIQPHLADGEVAILMHVGYEKMRYGHGYSIAVKNEGDPMCISLNEIYKKVEDEWGIRPSIAEY